ncbi:MAG TPA: GNAT family N-acetyltransferase [Cyclobacteriaceae bacterium]|nr:GNAT family N-acetyltransferase [Cyclobacteriaceae bacterium]
MNYLLTGLQSDRLLFRKLGESDFETWLEFFKNPLWNKYWTVEDMPPEGHCRQWFDKNFYRYSNGLGGMNVLIDKKSGAFIGQCGLLVQTVDGREELEVAYSIMIPYWNQGYATEAAKKCIDVAFENNWRDSLISIIHINNIESQKVAIKNGLAWDCRTTYDNNPVNIFRISRS